MKTIFIILNVIGGMALILLMLTMVGKKEYAEVVFEGPIFFSDLILILAVSIGPVIIGSLVLKDLNRGFLPSLLIILGSLSALTTYYTIPSVRQERVRNNAIQIEDAINNLADNRDYYGSDLKYYQHLMMELKMFHSLFENQYKFLVSAERIEDNRTTRVPMFFGILACILFLNAGRLIFVVKERNNA